MKKFNLLLIILILLNVKIINAQNIYSYTVGDFEISLLSERQSQGTKDVLIGATDKMVEEYIPNGTFPNAVNAFLIKTPENNILADAGFGIKLFDNLDQLGLTAKEINIILITHMHGDHITGLLKDGKTAFPNAKIYISQFEYNYWMNDEIMNSLPESSREKFKLPREVISAYKGKIHIFKPGEFNSGFGEILPGIRGITAYGHTPGHTMFLLESQDEQFLIWGDLTHAMDIQMPFPHIAVTYDTDPKTAVTSREKTLKYVSEHKIPIGGMHIAFPGMGMIEDNNAGGYRFIPFK
ncbi:MAG: MBL fold metallo-hydrolase [Bacteroidales bacterium]|jgi:glyoxylase-like metal-dependent hydrolase (beta-lactamase superfamily II)|nr:MBL fold metallo-hydrolase [Bacteroidales bacterium]